MSTILINLNAEKVLEGMKSNLSVKIKPLRFRKKVMQNILFQCSQV